MYELSSAGGSKKKQQNNAQFWKYFVANYNIYQSYIVAIAAEEGG